jgi:hypothetical protein
MQSYVDLPEGTAVGLSPADWFCAGTVNDEPWFIRRIDGFIWLFPDTGVIWWMSSRFEKVSDDLEAFLTDVVWGPRYPSLTGASDDDQWYELLQEIGRVE